METTLEELTEKTIDLLKAVRDGTATTADISRSLAELMVSARQRFLTNDGHVDWEGKSSDYREWLHGVYRRAGIRDPEERNRIQSAARYHVGEIRAREQVASSNVVSSMESLARAAAGLAAPTKAADRKRQLRAEQEHVEELLRGNRPPESSREAFSTLTTAVRMLERAAEYYEESEPKIEPFLYDNIEVVVKADAAAKALAKALQHAVVSAEETAARERQARLDRLGDLIE